MGKIKKNILAALLTLFLLISGIFIGIPVGKIKGQVLMCEKLNGSMQVFHADPSNPQCINHIIEKTCYSFEADYCYDNIPLLVTNTSNETAQFEDLVLN